MKFVCWYYLCFKYIRVYYNVCWFSFIWFYCCYFVDNFWGVFCVDEMWIYEDMCRIKYDEVDIVSFVIVID